MPKPAAQELTVAQLERELERKRSKLSLLTSKRERLQRLLAKTESQIAGLAGRTANETGMRRRRRRPKNAQSLRAHVVDLLSRNKKGLTIAELDERIHASGYKSKSRNFRNVLYQCLYNSEDVGQDKETGKYVLKG
jgi:hypothetical protein